MDPVKKIKLFGLIPFLYILLASPCFSNDDSGKDSAISDINQNESIIVGLDADISSGSAQSGEAIRRGIVLAMDEINQNGGVLGRTLKLIVRNHRGNPARGIDNIKELAKEKNLVAIMGGLHTPVALRELETIHQHQIIYLVPWAAGTPVIENGFNPNYAFRVSVRDEYAGGFLINVALKRGYRRIGLLLENTGWGRSNQRSMTAALDSHGLKPEIVTLFNWGVKDLHRQIDTFAKKGVDVIMLVANAPEGVVAVKSMAHRPATERIPIISHWGITGGRFFQEAKDDIGSVDLVFLQTFSFLSPKIPERAKRIAGLYRNQFNGNYTPGDIFSPAGTAHAYDLIHLLAMAIKNAKTIDRPAVRQALEEIEDYKGLVKNYKKPFSRRHHDALDASDFIIAAFDKDGKIIPVK